MLALASAPGARSAAEPIAVDFSVLSYNTHGLPGWVADDAPERRFPRIGALARAYDVVLLQEDFAHHGRLRAATGDLLARRGNQSRFRRSPLCLLFCEGSGLTFLTGLRPASLLDLSNAPYRTCAGWLGGANDCLATKGFQHARLLLAGEFEVHVVNTHLDAGGAPADRAARRAQLAELRAHLERSAAGAALVVAGDLNLDGAEPRDAALRDEFASALGLVDTGAAALPGSAWRRLDYVFRRDGTGVLLQVLEAGEAREFVDDAARPLSDHPALFVRLRARPTF